MADPFLRQLRKRLRRIRAMTRQAAELGRQKRRLHRLRVTFKQWRAQLRLLRATDPAFPYAEIYPPFKVLFSAAGAVRFWQLQASLLQHAPEEALRFAEAYRRFIRQNIRKARLAFRCAAEETPLPRWKDLKAELRQARQACTIASITTYFSALEESIQEHRDALRQTGTTDLHDLRKIIKEYYLNRRLARKYLDFDPGPPAGVPFDSPSFDEFLGEWHDLQAAGVQLDADLKQHPWPPGLRREGRRLQHAWQQREKTLFAEIAVLLR